MMPAKVLHVLAKLFEAARCARHSHCDRWEFAVEIDQLMSTGISTSHLRLLVRRGLVEHATEITLLGDRGRRFRVLQNLSFTERTCFVLTPTGIKAATAFLNRRAANASIGRNANESTTTKLLPAWDSLSPYHQFLPSRRAKTTECIAINSAHLPVPFR
jgi:hypothetical protein